MLTVLHVESDTFLTSAVQSAFEVFGFRGQFLTASTLKEAEARLAALHDHVDLIISDAELPDATGLDLVRLVRSSPVHRHVPIVILSADADASVVGRAYALGANAYVPRATHARTTAQIVRTIYEHWLEDARLPASAASGRTRSVIRRAVWIRSRIAQLYMNIAEQMERDDGEFWMGVAQREGNLANLLTFLLGRAPDREASDDALRDLEVHQDETLRVLDELAGKVPVTEGDAFRYLIALGPPTDSPAFANCAGMLFPVSPLAIATLLDAQAASFESAAAQIEIRTSDRSLRAGAAKLRENARSLRSML
jgi:DNA-binding NarL/FixJ family response regulator